MSTYKNTLKDRKIVDEVRDVMRLHHYSIHTERTYCDWIKRSIRYRNMTSWQDLIDGEAKIEAFLTRLAVDKAVAPSTRNVPAHEDRKPYNKDLDCGPRSSSIKDFLDGQISWNLD